MKLPRQINPEKNENPLPDGTRLWRYVPLKTLFFYLNGNVFIPAVEKLRQVDPFEGEFPFESWHFDAAMHQHYGKEFSSVREWIFRKRCTEWEQKDIAHNGENSELAARSFERRYFEFLRKTRFAWCWFSDCESAAMWSVYGNQGAAVATTVDKLCQILAKCERDFVFGRMRYVHVDRSAIRDVYPEGPHDQPFVLQPHFLKRREYKCEKEVRFVTCGPENHESGGICLSDLDPKDWIEKIRLWPDLTLTEATSLESVIKVIAPGIPCSRSDLMMNEHKFAAEHSGVMKWAEHQWKECTDGIPPGLKQID